MKNRKMKKIAALALTATMAVGLLAGCGSEGDSGSSSVAGGSSAASGQNESPAQGSESATSFRDELPDDFKITIMLQDFEGSPNSGEYGQKIHDRLAEITGYDFEIIWVPSTGYNDKVSTVLAGGIDGMPLIMKLNVTSGVVVSAAGSGAFWGLEDYLYDSEAYPYISQDRLSES